LQPEERGLLTIPCILGQVTQIFIGFFVTKFFSGMIDSNAEVLHKEILSDSVLADIDNNLEEVSDSNNVQGRDPEEISIHVLEIDK